MAMKVYPWRCKCTRGGASFYKCALDSASFFKAVQVCPWLCKVNISVPVTVQAFLKLYKVCPWLCKVNISVPVTVQAFLKLYKCARGYVRLI